MNQSFGINFLIDQSGQTAFVPRQIFHQSSEIKINDIMIFEYDPVFDKLKVYNHRTPEDFGYFTDLYKGKDAFFFQDSENKYCWVLSGSGSF